MLRNPVRSSVSTDTSSSPYGAPEARYMIPRVQSTACCLKLPPRSWLSVSRYCMVCPMISYFETFTGDVPIDVAMNVSPAGLTSSAVPHHGSTISSTTSPVVSSTRRMVPVASLTTSLSGELSRTLSGEKASGTESYAVRLSRPMTRMQLSFGHAT